MNFDQSFCDVDPDVPWPESADDFERRIVRESFCDGLDELARRILVGEPRLGTLRHIRAYAPRVVELLGRESAEAMIAARVGPDVAGFFARCVLPPAGPVHAIVCLADGDAALPPGDLEELRRFRAAICVSGDAGLADPRGAAYDWRINSQTP